MIDSVLKRQSLIKDTLIYVFSAGISKGLLFLLVPLFTEYLSVEEFGLYDYTLSIITILSIVF